MRIAIEPLTPEHAAMLFLALSDSSVYEHMDAAAPRNPNDLEQSFIRMYSGPPTHRSDEIWWNFAVRLLDSDQYIGRLEATIIDDYAEVAYLFGPEYWGHGYATEALSLLHAELGNISAVKTCWATARPTNVRSHRLLRRNSYELVECWPRLTSYDPGDWVFRREM